MSTPVWILSGVGGLTLIATLLIIVCGFCACFGLSIFLVCFFLALSVGAVRGIFGG